MKLLKSIICCLAVSMAFTSCNDWLDVNDDPPCGIDGIHVVQRLARR